MPTAHDLSNEGCPVECVGQRPSLDQWLSIHYIPAASNAWGGAGETLEDATADFALAQLARRLGDDAQAEAFLARAQYWRNLYNPTATPAAGYIQNRNDDGTWPAFDPASSEGFAEGSSAQYTWMVPFDARGLFEPMGGTDAASRRLDDFFHNADGSWALTRLGGLKAEMDNEPSIGAPWLYLFAGRPFRTQAAVRQAMNTLWADAPHGIPGNDDLGAMSAWYVWSAMGLYPDLPGPRRAGRRQPALPARRGAPRQRDDHRRHRARGGARRALRAEPEGGRPRDDETVAARVVRGRGRHAGVPPHGDAEPRLGRPPRGHAAVVREARRSLSQIRGLRRADPPTRSRGAPRSPLRSRGARRWRASLLTQYAETRTQSSFRAA